jgi:hydroxypyruvate isomerase
MYLSACIEWLFQAEHEDIADRVAAAKAAGLGVREFHLCATSRSNRIADAVKRTRPARHQHRGRPALSPREPRCHGRNRALGDGQHPPAAKAVGAPAMVVASGPAMPGVDEAATQAAMVTNLKAAASVVEAAGITLLV